MDRKDNMKNYENLWRAVVEQAGKDMQSANKEIKKEAIQWFLSNNTDYFEVMKLANLDGKELREEIKEKRRNG